MNATALIRPPAAPGPATSRSDAGDHPSAAASKRTSVGELLAELIPLIDAVPGEGPPVVFLVGPWLLLALLLCGPFAFLAILVVFMVVAATILVAVAAAMLAIVAAPWLLIRRLRRHRSGDALSTNHAAHLVPVESSRVVV